jgi:hypothetical protein
LRVMETRVFSVKGRRLLEIRDPKSSDAQRCASQPAAWFAECWLRSRQPNPYAGRVIDPRVRLRRTEDGRLAHDAQLRSAYDLPKSLQPKAKAALHEIWMAETKADATTAFNQFVAAFGAKYPKAVECLVKDRETLLAFYDFPAEHWIHIRTSNPIESTFATIRHRTERTKGCLTRDGMLSMIFKLGMSAEKNWRRLRGFEWLAKVINGVKVRDGIEVQQRVSKADHQTPRRVAA